MTKRPPRLEREPPWMRLGPAADAPDEGDDGERLWKQVAQRVKPLGETKHKKHAKSLPSPLEGEVARPKRATEGALSTGTPSASSPSARAARGHLPLKGGGKDQPPPLVSGQLAGLDRRSADKLRRGQMPVEATLDLHGMTQQAAHAAVARFIARQHSAGKRCLLIVTGKGKAGDPLSPKEAPSRFTYSSERGVLREALPRWLNEPALRQHIIAVSPARPEHGGAGASYVLLKRKRV
jgi:DNA-nicking Smr family endonuclease